MSQTPTTPAAPVESKTWFQRQHWTLKFCVYACCFSQAYKLAQAAWPLSPGTAVYTNFREHYIVRDDPGAGNPFAIFWPFREVKVEPQVTPDGIADPDKPGKYVVAIPRSKLKRRGID